MRLYTSCELAFEIPAPTPFVLMSRPRSGTQQWITREEYRIIRYNGLFRDACTTISRRGLEVCISLSVNL